MFHYTENGWNVKQNFSPLWKTTRGGLEDQINCCLTNGVHYTETNEKVKRNLGGLGGLTLLPDVI